MSRVINILHVIGGLDVGGAEVLLRHICGHINKSRYKITVCSLGNKGLIGREIEQLGIPVIGLGTSGRAYDLRVTRQLLGLIKAFHPDVIHCHMFKANFHGRVAGVGAGVPVIIATEQNRYEGKRKVDIWADRLLAQVSSKIIACSESVKQFTAQQEGIPLERFVVIHNGINTSDFFTNGKDGDQARKELGFEKNALVIGTVGRLVEQKGHRYLVDAMRQILQAFPMTRALIVGEGDLRQKLEEQVASMGLSGYVKFAGSRRDIPRLLSAMNVFAFPSLWEGLPIALMEAMAIGLPVVASDVDGIPEVVDNEITGMLMPPRNSALLAEALMTILDNQTLARMMGKRGRERVLSQFTIDHYLERLDALYQSLLSRS